MALTKETVQDKIEVTSEGVVQIRTATRVIEDGEVIAVKYHRSVIPPGQDYSNETGMAREVAERVHTADRIAAYRAKMEANELEVNGS